ncbi:MAG: M48 family metalloprotease [Pseudomonadota bacterium]
MLRLPCGLFGLLRFKPASLRFASFGLIGVAGLGLSACQIIDTGSALDPSAVSETGAGKKKDMFSFDALRAKDPQAKLGAKEHPAVLKANGGVYSNERLEDLLAVITGSLVTHSDDPTRAYNITVLNSPSVNAFALPGGYLYVTRGLLALANDASEVAAVISHEMAHVTANHGIERNRKAAVQGVADRVVNDVVSNRIAGRVAQESTRQRLIAFSQRQELQADALGIALLGKAGFDPFAGARFLVAMDRYGRWRSANRLSANAMSTSHPSTPKRIELARRHARKFGPEGIGQTKRRRYLAGIEGLLWGDRSTEGFVRGRRFSHTTLGVTFEVPEGFELSNRTDAVLASGNDQQALRFDTARTAGAPASAAAYLASGWVNGLRGDTVERRTINGMDAAFGLAQAGDWRFAIGVVKRKGYFYRFIMAAPRGSPKIAQLNRQIVQSFRALTAAEKTALRPLRLRIHTVERGETIASVAAKMQGMERRRDLFLVLNGLQATDRLKAGQRVKIIAE